MMKKALVLAVLAGISQYAAANDTNHDWTVKVGLAHVSPNDDSGTVLGGGVGVEADTGLGISFTRMLDDNWGFEILGALPFTHEIVGTGALSGASLGETKHLPPTVSAIYQWGDETKFHVGAGLNYTKFFDEEASPTLNAALNADADLSLDASTGLAVQFGFETPINESWNFSGSFYYMNIETTADIIVNDAVAASVDVDINPWVAMLGVSRSF